MTEHMKFGSSESSANTSGSVMKLAVIFSLPWLIIFSIKELRLVETVGGFAASVVWLITMPLLALFLVSGVIALYRSSSGRWPGRGAVALVAALVGPGIPWLDLILPWLSSEPWTEIQLAGTFMMSVLLGVGGWLASPRLIHALEKIGN